MNASGTWFIQHTICYIIRGHQEHKTDFNIDCYELGSKCIYNCIVLYNNNNIQCLYSDL